MQPVLEMTQKYERNLWENEKYTNYSVSNNKSDSQLLQLGKVRGDVS